MKLSKLGTEIANLKPVGSVIVVVVFAVPGVCLILETKKNASRSSDPRAPSPCDCY